MWCIGTLTEEYRRRMYGLLALYAKPLKSDEPVICIDEKSLQLLSHTREPLPRVPSNSPRCTTKTDGVLAVSPTRTDNSGNLLDEQRTDDQPFVRTCRRKSVGPRGRRKPEFGLVI